MFKIKKWNLLSKYIFYFFKISFFDFTSQIYFSVFKIRVLSSRIVASFLEAAELPLEYFREMMPLGFTKLTKKTLIMLAQFFFVSPSRTLSIATRSARSSSRSPETYIRSIVSTMITSYGVDAAAASSSSSAAASSGIDERLTESIAKLKESNYQLNEKLLKASSTIKFRTTTIVALERKVASLQPIIDSYEVEPEEEEEEEEEEEAFIL